MATSSVKLRIEGMQDVLELLDSKNAQRASSRSLKRMTQMVKTEASSTIRDEYNIRKADLDPYMVMKLPAWNELTSEITVTGKPISLIYFGARQLTAQNRVISWKSGKQLKRSSRSLQGGVTYQIIKGRTMNLPHAFIAYDSRLNRVTVFQRKGKTRLAIKAIRFITIASLFASQKTMDAIHVKINDSWTKVFKHELLFALDKQG